MKKSSKGFILIGLATSVIAINGFAQTVVPIKTNITKKEMLNYNQNPQSALENTFKEDGMIIIPFIYKSADQKLTVSSIREEFRKAGLTIKKISTNDIGTGTKITVNENSNEYVVLIYGDVTGEGDIDIYDAVRVIRAAKFPTTSPLTGIARKAGNVYNDDNIIDVYDAMRLISFNKKIQKNVILNAPQSVKEKNYISSIEIERMPNKTRYNYGESTIDLTGARLKINWKYDSLGLEKTSTAITESMISKCDFSTSGEKTITVTYAGKKTSFKIRVLDKIEGIKLIEDTNIQKVDGGYLASSKQDFILGKIVPTNANQANLSKMDINKINITTKLQSSTNVGATNESLKFTKSLDANGNIVLKGKSNENGIYEVTISYENSKITAVINIEKSDDVKSINLKSENSIVRVGKPLLMELEVKNKNDELIDIKANSISFDKVPEGIQITKLDADKDLIGDEHDYSVVKYIQVSTTIRNPQENLTFDMNINGAKKEVNVKVIEPQIVKKVIVENSNIPLYLENKDGVTRTDELDGNIYTISKIKFEDQVGEEMDVKTSDIRIIPEKALEHTTIEEDQIALILPGEIGITAKIYDANPKELGIAIIQNPDVDLEAIKGKTIKFVNSNKDPISEQISLDVIYKKITTITINTDATAQENVTPNTDGNYVVKKGESFVLGTISTIKNDEGPLTDDMLTATIKKEGTLIPDMPKANIKITFVEEGGKIVIKGEAYDEGLYEITPGIKDSDVTADSIVVKVEAPDPVVTDFELDDLNLEVGKTMNAALTVKTNTDEPTDVKYGDIELKNYGESIISVKCLTKDYEEISENQNERVVKYLQITSLSEGDAEASIGIKFFGGEEITKTISVYKPIPVAIDIDSTVNLSGTDNKVTDGGLEYTLVSIKAWADAEKTKPITLSTSMFRTLINGVPEPANKIGIKVPYVKVE